MVSPVEPQVICPVLIGRATQLEALNSVLAQAGAGHGQAVLLAGEAGIGKSRLVAETKARAADGGFTTLEGRCFEPDHALPYAPLLSLLRGRFASRAKDEIIRDLGPTGPELVKLVPELAALLQDVRPSPALEPEQEKRRLFEALTQIVVGRAAAGPLVVIIEDLHWSDDISLEFLLHLARRIAGLPLLLLLTYRSDEVRPSLRHFLAQLDRERLAVELSLPRLSLSEVEGMLRAIFEMQRPARLEFVEALHALTDGNPFFVEEVLKSLTSAGDIFYADGTWSRKPMSELHIPRSVQDAVQRRSEQLSAGARDLLSLAAVAGQRFDFALLQEMSHAEEAELLRRVKELIGAQLIVEESVEQFAFRHALTRQAVYVGLLARERRPLHRSIAGTLERLYEGALDGHLADLAYHFYEAEAWEKALAYAQRAGEKAQALYAPHAALEHFTRAVHATERLAVKPSPALYRARAIVCETLGDFEGALADHEAALAQARAGGDRQVEWQALLDLGMLWAGRDYTETGRFFEQALAFAREMGDQSAIAQSLNRVGNWHLNVEQPQEALGHHQEALSIFEELHDQRGTAQTLDLLGITNIVGANLIQATAYYEQAVALYRQLDDRQGIISCLATLTLAGGVYNTDIAAPAARLVDSAQHAEVALRMAREIGWRSAESYALWNLGFCLGAQGDYGRALAAAKEGLAIAEDIEHRQWMAAAHFGLGALYLDLLALPQAKEHLEQALSLARETASGHWTDCAAGLLASTHIQQRALASAEAVLDAVLSTGSWPQTIGQKLCQRAWAELLLARNDAVAALDVLDRLIASDPNVSAARSIPGLLKLRGDALAMLGRGAEAEATLRAAQEGAASQGARPLLWRAHVALANLYQVQRRRGEAQQEFVTGRAIVEELGGSVPEELREGFLRAAAALLPVIVRSPRQTAKDAFGGLTEREREVATLVARGLSNRDIGEALVVGERTVETHVSNILTKLALTSRAQIAAWAVERGLTSGPG